MFQRSAFCLLTTFALLALFALPATADVIMLQNGDRISGTVVSMDHGKLVVKTSYADKISIKWSEVTSLTTDKDLRVQDLTGKMIQGKASPGPDKGELSLAGQKPMALKNVAAINPEDMEPFKVHGSVTLGVDISRGNTNKANVDGTGRAVATWKTINRAVAGFEIHQAESKGVDTADSSLGYIEYNRFVNKRWYWLANLRGEQDRFKNIDFRGMTGVGIGYQVWKSKLTNLAFEFGPDFVYLEDSRTGEHDWFAWRWQIVYDRWFFKDFVQFYHRQTAFVAMDNFDNFLWNGRQGLNFPLGMGFLFNIAYNIDYDNEPDAGKSKTDVRFLLNLGYSW